MVASGSGAPSATMGSVHIAHSLAGSDKMDGCALPTGTKTGGKGAEGSGRRSNQIGGGETSH